MPEFETIRQRAQQALTSAQSGNADSWLWDRTLRILRNVEYICRLPELARQATSIDRSCLITATYFAESGMTNASTKDAGSMPSDSNDADVCNRSTQMVSTQLAAVISDTRIDKVNQIIKESSSRFSSMTEAMILSDARNLEDMGTIGLLHEFRRNIIHGKSISDLLESWKCKIEYGYWQARIKESFRFDPVRRIAEQRLANAASLMDQLAAEHNVCDLEEQLMETLEQA